jgi:1-acyl-sn-glycerol-3-phosphate acyltransferase
LKIDLARGQSILIFPEGTMNKTEADLADFYDGAFRLAIETQTDIAPMVILNARNLLPRANPLSVKPGLITCIFDEPVSVAGLQAEDLEDLKAKVRKRMENLIKNSI